jgi:hypothetical protein
MKKMKCIKCTCIFIIIVCQFCFFPKEVSSVNNHNLQCVYKSQNFLRISSKYSKSNDLWIQFNKIGINNIFGISSLYLANNTNPSVNPNLTRESQVFLKAFTDWIGPYKVKSNNSAMADNRIFTGGWHSIKKNNIKIPTAKTLNYTITADGKAIQLDQVTYCNKVKIDVVNLIQGFNSLNRDGDKKYILKETINYTIFCNNVDVSVKIEALEDITILKYYGLQTQNTPWEGKIQYINSQYGNKVIDYTFPSNSGAKKDYPNAKEYNLFSISGNDKLKAWIDSKYGIGKMQYVSDSLPCAFTPATNKSYFNLINGISVSLKKYSKLYWRGGYIFSAANTF